LALLIDIAKCVSCGGCAEVCPGGLLDVLEDGVAIPYPEDCWGCAACLKACPAGALSLRLSPSLGGRGGSLACGHREDGALEWYYVDPSGKRTLVPGGGDSY
jgi:adenylylsulfate reductase subunit B